jgi:hypothetical protein
VCLCATLSAPSWLIFFTAKDTKVITKAPKEKKYQLATSLTALLKKRRIESILDVVDLFFSFDNNNGNDVKPDFLV